MGPISPLGAASIIELIDDRTATLDMLNNSYSLEWEIEKSPLKTSFVIIFAQDVRFFLKTL